MSHIISQMITADEPSPRGSSRQEGQVQHGRTHPPTSGGSARPRHPHLPHGNPRRYHLVPPPRLHHRPHRSRSHQPHVQPAPRDAPTHVRKRAYQHHHRPPRPGRSHRTIGQPDHHTRAHRQIQTPPGLTPTAPPQSAPAPSPGPSCVHPPQTAPHRAH